MINFSYFQLQLIHSWKFGRCRTFGGVSDAMSLVSKYASFGSWSSALFPAKSPKPDSTSAEVQNGDRAADERRSPGRAGAAVDPNIIHALR
jgi:hypothetical protein